MRIALIYKRLALHGGSERQLVLLVRDLCDRGHAVHVFCAAVRAELPSAIRLHVMPPLPLGSLGRLLAFSAWARAAVAREERRNGPFDVRHAFGRTHGQDVYRVGGGCHPTYLEHAHALDRPAWMRRLLRHTPLQRLKADLERRALVGPPAPHVITNSRMTRDDLEHRYGLASRRLHLVRNGVDLEQFRPPVGDERAAVRAGWGLTSEDEVALFLGTGYARKGLEVALRAIARLARRRPRLHLVVAGDHRRPRYWRALATALGLDDRVLWLGPRDDPERCYRGADVFVLPTAYDPAANSTLEALASGVPVVTTSRDGAAEILEDGIHGSVLTTPVHPDDVAAALEAWLARTDRTRVAARARELAERYPSSASC